MSESHQPHHQRPHRPALPGDRVIRDLAGAGGADASAHAEAADRAATALVRGARDDVDPDLVDRVVTLAADEGIDALAELWASAPPDSLAGCLWRLFLIREWVHGNPVRIAQEYDAGRLAAPVHEVVAGVVDPPDPEAVKHLVDRVLAGVVSGDFADTLFRAAAFTRVTAYGRMASAPGAPESGSTYAEDLGAARLLTLADQLEHAGRLELAGDLA